MINNNFIPNLTLSIETERLGVKNKFDSVACNGGPYGFSSNLFIENYKLYFCPYYRNIIFDKKHIPLWVDFMNKCGFPCSITLDKNTAIIEINYENYTSITHAKCAVTIIRYPFYGRCRTFQDIAIKALTDFLSSGNAFDSLKNAHNTVIPKEAYYDSNHGVGTINISEKEFEKRIKNKHLSSVNNFFLK